MTGGLLTAPSGLRCRPHVRAGQPQAPRRDQQQPDRHAGCAQRCAEHQPLWPIAKRHLARAGRQLCCPEEHLFARDRHLDPIRLRHPAGVTRIAQDQRTRAASRGQRKTNELRTVIGDCAAGLLQPNRCAVIQAQNGASRRSDPLIDLHISRMHQPNIGGDHLREKCAVALINAAHAA